MDHVVHHPRRWARSAAVITLDTALTAARQTLATVTERAERQGYYGGARTDIINSHAELRAALDMLVKAAEHNGIHDQSGGQPDPGVGGRGFGHRR